jgi:integrase
METRKWTTKELENLSEPDKYRVARRLFLQVSTFTLKAGTTGIARSWLFCYTSPAGKAREMGLGSLADVGLADAKDAAAKLNARLLLEPGFDPLEEKRAAKAQALTTAKTKAENDKNTFESVAREWYENEHKAWRSDIHRENVTRIIDKKCVDLHKLPISDITEKHVLQVLLPVWEKTPESGLHMRQVIEAILKRAIGLDLHAGPNPASMARLEHRLPKQHREVKHHATVELDALPGFYAQLKQLDEASDRALRLLMLTATRTGDVLGATTSQFNLGRNEWVVPATKEVEEFKVPLTQEMVEIVKPLLDKAQPDALLFAMDASTMRKRMQSLTGATPHGLRASFKSWAHERSTGHDDKVIEMTLAHKITGTEVEKAYQRSDLLAKRHKLLVEWAQFLTTPTTTAQVIEIADRKSA